MDLSNLNLSNPGVLVPIIVVLVFAPVCVGLVIWAISLQLKISASRGWSSTPGRIITSELATRSTAASRGNFSAYYPKVVYEYQVGGQTYQGDRIMFGQFPAHSSPDLARRKLAQYQLHSTGQVFYNPANPSDAVLEQSAMTLKTLCLVAGGILLLILIVLGLAFLLGNLLPNRNF
jgi:hypothetical protein